MGETDMMRAGRAVTALIVGRRDDVVGSGAVSAVRTYAGAGGVPVAERVGSTGSAAVLVWLFTDVNGTVDTQTVAGTGVTTRQYRDPFGVPLGGASGVWGDGNGFLNKPATTTTGLSSLGARSYDPALGAFTSPDPLLNTADPRHANAYAYGYNSPVSYSDASGLAPVMMPSLDGASASWHHAVTSAAPRTTQIGTSAVGCAASSYAAACHAPVASSVPGCGVNYGSCGARHLTAEQQAQMSIGAHTLLTTVGLVPGLGEIADGIDGVLCLAENDLVCAGLSFASMIPFAGWAASAGKCVKIGDEIAEVAANSATTASRITSPLWSATGSKSAAQYALSHFNDHAADYPHMSNSLEYVAEAQGFLRSLSASTLTKVRANGDIVRYDPTTDLFGVMNSTGAPRTYFRPDPSVHGFLSNMDYFNAQ